MKTIISLLTILSTLGCQSPKHVCPTDPQLEKITITVMPHVERSKIRVEPVDKADYSVEFKITKSGGDERMGPLIPTINHWADTSRAIDIKGYKSTASVLIEDESIEIDCEPGLHIKFKCTPLEDNVVKIKGVIISSKESEKNLIKPKLIYPFTVSCELGKTTTAFELKTELEQ